ncbi:MAG TPA: hypothetical protein VGZ22_08075 [Isosphaeraceae bacterium]|jgi:hypothetical protein|nr:hypothetical protein [Isosphaeraceae bacterium]
MQDPLFDETAPKEKRRGHGCLFYGCITLIVLLVVGGLAVFLGLRALYNKAYEFTEDKPMVFPKLQLSEEERAAVKKRFDDFKAAVKEGKPAEPLVLDSDDCNALIQSGEDNSLRDRVYVKIEGDEIKGQVSWPLDGIPGMKGRFANGEADFKVSLVNGLLVATIDSLSVKGKPLPPEVMAGLRGKNLAEDMNKDPENVKALEKLESIEVKDGKIIIKARKPEAKVEGEDKAKTEDKEKAEDKAKDATDKADDKPADAPKDKPPSDPEKPAEPKAAA